MAAVSPTDLSAMITAALDAAGDRVSRLDVEASTPMGSFHIVADLLPRVPPLLRDDPDPPDPLEQAADNWRRRSGD